MVEQQRVARQVNELEWLDLLTTGEAEIELVCECGPSSRTPIGTR